MLQKIKNQDLVESFSGIRGIYGQSITPELAKKYAWCYCQLFGLKRQSLVIAGDTRHSTPVLKKAMLQTFSAARVKKIIDVGVVPIQVAEHAVVKFQAQGGVYISASHNEPEYNGWKFLKSDGALIYASQSERLIDMVHNYKGSFPESLTPCYCCKQKEAIDCYIQYVLKRLGKISLQKIRRAGFRILADPNGGSAITVLNKLFAQLGVKAKIINNKLGKFVRLVEPNVDSLASLSKEFKGNKFEFACGFDCDADRVEFVISPDSEFGKEMGAVVSGQYVLALACDSQLSGTKNQIVVVNDATSELVRDVIKKYQAKMKEVEVGEMNVVEEMEKQKSIIGGEGSNGGVIIPPIKCRDGIMTIVLILKMLAERQKSLVEILQSYPKYYSERTQVNCSPREAIKIKNKIEKYFRLKGYKIKKTGGDSGGLKALADRNSYVWFRQSKTEAGTFRIIADGDGHQKVKELLKEGISAFNTASKEK